MAVTKAQVAAAVELAFNSPDQWAVMSALLDEKIVKAVSAELTILRVSKAKDTILEQAKDEDLRDESFEESVARFGEAVNTVAETIESIAVVKTVNGVGRGNKKFTSRQIKSIPVANGELTVILKSEVR